MAHGGDEDFSMLDNEPEEVLEAAEECGRTIDEVISTNYYM